MCRNLLFRKYRRLGGLSCYYCIGKKITVKSLDLDLQKDADRPRLFKFLGRAMNVPWSIDHDIERTFESWEHWEDKHFAHYFKELAIWKRVPGFRCIMPDKMKAKWEMFRQASG